MNIKLLILFIYVFSADYFIFGDRYLQGMNIYFSFWKFNTRTGGGSENHTVWRGGGI